MSSRSSITQKEKEPIQYPQRDREESVVHIKNTPQKDWPDHFWSSLIGLFCFVYSPKRLVVLRTDRCGYLFSFFLAYDWKGLEREREDMDMDIFSPGVIGEAENGLRPSRLVWFCFYSASSFLFLLCSFGTYTCQEMEGDGERGVIAIILLSM